MVCISLIDVICRWQRVCSSISGDNLVVSADAVQCEFQGDGWEYPVICIHAELSCVLVADILMWYEIMTCVVMCSRRTANGSVISTPVHMRVRGANEKVCNIVIIIMV